MLNQTRMKITSKIVAASLAFSLAAALTTKATVIDVAPTGGYGYFQDTNTGRIWLDMNTFFSTSYGSMLTTATGLGLTVADLADVQELLNSLPLTGGEWPSYSAIMGSAPNRGLIWGGYDNGLPNTTYDYAWSYSGDLSWNYDAVNHDYSVIENFGQLEADMNIWAYREGSAIPDCSSTIVLLALGAAGLVELRRQKR